MKILALIPARGGSKRLPGKNIRVLGDMPLIAWSIEVAKGISQICDILVSTDDSAIAEVCKGAGALVPWLRPPDLATDTSSSIDVALHALDWYEAERGSIDGVLLLQPTSPFRSRVTIQRGLKLFEELNRQTVLAVSHGHDHPLWAMKIEDGHLVPFAANSEFDARKQDLPAAFYVNGSLYLNSPAQLRSDRSFVGMRSVPLIVDSPEEALDIDTAWDWKLAEFIVSQGKCCDS